MPSRIRLFSPRMIAVTLLGFASSLPLALTSSTLQAWFTQAGMSLMSIGVLTLVGLPYMWKFLWAPAMDKIIPPFLGRRRGWMALTQFALSMTLFGLANLIPNQHANLMGWLALVIAFFSASQDIAIDAYRTDILQPEERSMGTAYFILSARIALLISGGLALVMADYIGWRFTYEIMALLMGASILVSYFAPDVASDIKPPVTIKDAIVEPFKNLLQRNKIGLILLFIAIYKIGDALALALMSNFLLHTLHFSLTQVGIAYKTMGLLATIIGAGVGGYFLPRLGLYRALFVFGFAQACSNLMFMVLALAGKHLTLMMSAIFIESFCSGTSTTALVVLLTVLCHPQFSATQFASLSALSALGRIFSGPIAAVLVQHLGWPSFFGLTFLICFPGLLLLIGIRKKVRLHAECMA